MLCKIFQSDARLCPMFFNRIIIILMQILTYQTEEIFKIRSIVRRMVQSNVLHSLGIETDMHFSELSYSRSNTNYCYGVSIRSTFQLFMYLSSTIDMQIVLMQMLHSPWGMEFCLCVWWVIGCGLGCVFPFFNVHDYCCIGVSFDLRSGVRGRFSGSGVCLYLSNLLA